MQPTAELTAKLAAKLAADPAALLPARLPFCGGLNRARRLPSRSWMLQVSVNWQMRTPIYSEPYGRVSEHLGELQHFLPEPVAGEQDAKRDFKQDRRKEHLGDELHRSRDLRERHHPEYAVVENVSSFCAIYCRGILRRYMYCTPRYEFHIIHIKVTARLPPNEGPSPPNRSKIPSG